MNQENTSSAVGPMLLTFLAGAAVGAVVVALTTPKTGPELRGHLKDFASRAKRKVGDLAAGACEVCGSYHGMAECSAGGIERDIAETADGLRG